MINHNNNKNNDNDTDNDNDDSNNDDLRANALMRKCEAVCCFSAMKRVFHSVKLWKVISCNSRVVVISYHIIA